MRCPSCHQENPNQAKFCGVCGSALSRTCPTCGMSNSIANSFCHQCGQRIAAPEPPTARFSSPEDYTPQHLAAKILANRKAIARERKQVTVLFADVSGSVAIMDALDPEDAYQLMNPCFDLMLDAIHRYEGTVTEFMGDGLMAIFGAPIAHEDHALRAVYAALDMQHTLMGYQEKLLRTRGINFRVRMGLNTGLVVVGSVSDTLRVHYTALGDTTNVAARLLTVAGPGQIVLAAETYRIVRDYVVTRSLGKQTVKGKAQPIETYEVLRARGLRTRIDIGVEHGLTPFVGRARELSLLLNRLRKVRRGQGQVVHLRGEPGIGKSRLVLEFRHRLEHQAVTWLGGRCVSYGQQIAYLPIIDLLKQHFQVDEGDDEATLIAKIERGTRGISTKLSEFTPYFRYLLTLDPGDDAVLAMDARQRRLAIFEALRTLIFEGARIQSLILAIEDLQWIDKTSEEVLRYLIDSLADAPVLLLLSYRPNYPHPFMKRDHSLVLDLRRLPDDQSIKIAEGVLAAPELPEELQRLIIHKAEGNPFFVEEVIKSLREVLALKKQNDHYVLAKKVTEIYVPDTIQDLIMARIDRLEETTRGILQHAAVIGREFTASLLGRITNLNGQLAGHLLELQELGLIHERTPFPELTYTFQHAMTHDATYNSLLLQHRKDLHVLVGQTIEEIYADRLAEYYEMLAYHYEHGELWDKAIEYLVKSGQKAQAAYANEEAFDHYQRALAICAHPHIAPKPAPALAIHAGLGAVHFVRSEFRASVEAYRHMLEISRQTDDRASEVAALYQIGFGLAMAHEFEQARDYSEQARALAQAIDSKDMFAASNFIMGFIHSATGEIDQASTRLEEALRISREVRNYDLEGYNLNLLGLVRSWTGDYDQALQLQGQGVALGKRHNLQFLLLWILWAHGLSCCGKGHYNKAIESLQQALEISERLDDKVYKCRTLNSLGWVYQELHSFEQSIGYNQAGLAAAEQIGDPEIIRNAAINLGDNYLLLGDLDQAQFHLDTVYHDARQRGRWGEEWMKWRYMQHCCHSLGELWLLRGDTERALALADECLALATPTMSRKNLIKGWRLKGQAWVAEQHLSEAHMALTTALQIAQAIGNPPQLWKTYGALGELHERLGARELAQEAYRSAIHLIEQTGDQLQSHDLRQTFLAARPVQRLRALLERLEDRSAAAEQVPPSC